MNRYVFYTGEDAYPLHIQQHERMLLERGCISLEECVYNKPMPARMFREFTPNTPELRALRLWHWNQALSVSKSLRRFEARITSAYNRRQIASLRRRYNRHMLAVQALNDVVDGTAETDAYHVAVDSLTSYLASLTKGEPKCPK